MNETGFFLTSIFLIVGIINSLYLAEQTREIKRKGLSIAVLLNIWVIASAGITVTAGLYSPNIPWVIITLVLILLSVFIIMLLLRICFKSYDNTKDQDDQFEENNRLS